MKKDMQVHGDKKSITIVSDLGYISKDKDYGVQTTNFQIY